VRYVDQVIGERDGMIDYRFGRALLDEAGLDVVHLPSFRGLFGAQGPTGPRLVAETIRFGRDLRRRRIALVRTLTEADRHGGRWQRLAARALDRFTTAYVVLDDTVTPPGGKPVTLIPYADLGARFVGYPRAAQVPDRVLWLGAGRLEAGVEELVASGVPQDLGLRFVGAAGPRTQVRLAGLDTRLERLSDGALIQEITAATLVVVPAVEEPEDLSAVHTALSLDRPVLVPDTPAMRSLQRDIGEAWIHLGPLPVTAETLRSVLGRLHDDQHDRGPTLPGASLVETAERYAEVFRAASAAAG
jgi:beta-1,4-mannosyltransferase